MKNLPNDFISNIHSYGINPRTREIFLHAYFDADEEPGVDYRMTATFIKNIMLLNHQGSTPIYIHMSSVGGDWNSGMAIYDAIRASVAPVVIVAYAHARSMTSIILQAGDLRLMTPNADFMIHYGTSSIEDTSVGFITAAQWLEEMNKVMLNIYADRCSNGVFFKNYYKSPKDKRSAAGLSKIKGFLDRKMKDKQEWYLTADQAVEYGFADGVMGKGKQFDLADILTNNIDVKKEEWKI